MNSPNQILVISLTFVVCLLLQMNTAEKHHGKSKTRDSANQIHPAWCRGFEFKSEQRVNLIWIHDASFIIYDKSGKKKWYHIVSPGMQGYSYYVVNHNFNVVWTFLLNIVLYWTIVQLTQWILIFGSNNKLLHWRNTTSVCNILTLA